MADRKKILVVDDDADLRRTLVLLLGQDYELVEASCGTEAIDRLVRGRPDLVLLDVTMPGMDGIEVLQSARLAHPQLLVLMLTAEPDLTLAVAALTHGANAYITKPFDPNALKDEVRRLLDLPADGKTDDPRPWRTAA